MGYLFLVSNGPARFVLPLFPHFYVLHETEVACEHKENAVGEKSKWRGRGCNKGMGFLFMMSAICESILAASCSL